MDSARWQRIEEIYYSVVETPVDERDLLLDRACHGDTDLRQEIESLLRSDGDVGDFLSPEKLRGHIVHVAKAARSPAVGATLGEYEILGVLGAGAMGQVYRARDRRLGREVALKILPPHLTSDGARVTRFQSEARAASALNHPNTITIYEIGQAAGTWFIAAELIPGVTLRERLKAGKLPLQQIVDIFLQCAAALQAAHAGGIVHRDIKPENIMIRPDGVVKVVDFGLARILEPQTDWAIDATLTGSVMGTPRYMSPEQAHGRKPDARSDIFSLGTVLAELLTGRPAFPGSTTPEVFAALLDSEPDIAGAGPLEGVVYKALAKDPADRYQTVEEFARNLRAFDPAETRPFWAWRPGRWLQIRARKAAVAVLLAAVGGMAGYIWLSGRDAPADKALNLTRLTTFGGSKQHAAFSPDGSRIAFSWRTSDNGTHHIYVKPIATGQPIQVTFGSEEDAYPTWSPDGGQIAFCRRTVSPDERAPVPSAIYIVSAAGGAERRIAENCGGISWSTDGKTLAVARVPDETPDSGGVDVLNLESNARRRLTRSGEDLRPVVSPDGKWIAFIRVLPGRGRWREIFVVPASGGQARQVTFGGDYISAVTWTSDSREIVFASPRNKAQGSFWRIPLWGGPPRPISAALRSAASPSISRQGNRLAFIESTTDSNVHLRAGPGFPRAGMPWQFEAPTGAAVSTGTDHSPVFSPDGERFAFVSDRSDRIGNNQIWVARRDGSEAVPLTSFATHSGSPRWSPDGEWIAFDLWASNESNVYLVSSRGGASRRVSPEPGESWNPAWSHDGKWIYFTSQRSGASEIWKMPADGGAAIQVTRTGAYEGRPSPDGRAIYFRKSAPVGAIWSVPAGGGREEPVRELEKFAISRSWGVLNEGIYFIARQNEARQTVRFLSFATREVADVVKLEKEPEWSFLGLAISPDGRYLLNVQVDREANDLMMIENFH
jgi:Tol biopolymer transport system component